MDTESLLHSFCRLISQVGRYIGQHKINQIYSEHKSRNDNGILFT